jgi:SAM-dependent methyltransferase
MVGDWTNEAAIRGWNKMSFEELSALGSEGDFGRKHMLNPVVFRLLGELRGMRVLDAGCGNGYLSRLMAQRGALVTGVEPAAALYEYALAQERDGEQRVRYIQADLSSGADIGSGYDVVVANMVFLAIPDWRAAMRNCVAALRVGGLFVFSVNHPCFEGGIGSWVRTGCLEIREYLHEYERTGPHGPNFHRPLSWYVNEVVQLGCHINEMAEPGLDPQTAASDPDALGGYVHFPDYIVIAASKT